MRRHLVTGGVSRRFIDAQIAARRWRRLNAEVIALHNGPLTSEQSRLAVFLSAQSPAALCGLTAAALWGLRGFETPVVHVLVRRGARVLDVPGVDVAVHESRRFAASDVRTLHPPQRVGVERAVIDAAAWTTEGQAARLLVASVQQRLTSPPLLAAELVRAGAIRHNRLMRLLVADLDGGARALSEVEFTRFCRRHRLPTPAMNVRVDTAGRRRYLDATLTSPAGVVARIEIDGGVHLSLTQRWRDTLRDNQLLLAGTPVLRFPSVAIYTDDPEAVRQVRIALRLVST